MKGKKEKDDDEEKEKGKKKITHETDGVVFEACLYVALSVPLAIFPLKFGEFLGILLFISGEQKKNRNRKSRKSMRSNAISISETPEKVIET